MAESPVPRRGMTREPLRRQLLRPLVFFVIVYTAGVFGYYLIGLYFKDQPDSLIHCVYQVGILLASVGFTDILSSHDTVAGIVFTVIMALFGVGFLLWIISTVTAFIMGGQLTELIGRDRMRKRIDELRDHYVVCGGGETGQHTVRELVAAGHDVVLVEVDAERIDHLLRDIPDLLYLQDDASDDDVLRQAGIDRAVGLVSALPNDKDNLLLVVTARQMNPALRIVSRCVETENERKLRRIGADAVVSPNTIGGQRMAGELICPTVANFLDQMVHDQRNIRMEEAVIPEHSSCAGKTLAQIDLARVADVNIIALRNPGADYFVYNPRGETSTVAGTALVLIGAPDEIAKAREALSE